MRLVSGTLLDLIVVLINRNDDETRFLAKGILGLYTSTQVRESSDQALVAFYISLVNQIVREKIDKSTPDLLLTALIKFEGMAVFDEHPELKDRIKQLFSPSERLPEDVINRKLSLFRSALRISASQAYVRGLYRKIQELDDLGDEEEQLKKSEELEVLIAQGSPSATRNENSNFNEFSPSERISTDEPDTIDDSLCVYATRNTDTAVFKTGLKALNKSFGPIGGVPEGRGVCFVAKANNYKSSILRSMVFWRIAYNEAPLPTEEDPRTAAIYFNSVENGTHEDIVWLYRKMYYYKHKEEPKLNIDSAEWRRSVTAWVVDFAKSRGYTLIMERYLPSAMTADKLIRIVDKYNQKYRVVLVVSDYLGRISPPAGLQRDQQQAQLYSEVLNWHKNAGITFITAHQTNTKFSEDTMNKANKVKYWQDRHIKDGPDAIREVDLLFFILKEENNFGKEFLTIIKAKDRYRDDTPLIDKYFAYEFVEPGIGGIKDDVGTDDINYVRDINDVKGDDVSLTHDTGYSPF